ncbi:hypothetical protein Tco_0145554 [Tanacetum coccineum]
MSEFKQTNQFAEDVSSILGIVDNYLASKMKDVVDVAIQLQTNKLREEAQAKNHEFLNQVDSTMKSIIKEKVQAQVSKIMPKIKKYVTESLGAEVLVRSTNKPQTSYAIAASKNLYNTLVKSYNSDKDIISSYGDVVTLKRGRDDQEKDEDPSAGLNFDDLEDQSHQEFNTGNDDETSAREALDDDESQWNPSSSSTPDRE